MMAAMLGVTTTAWAYWTSSGAGTGAATTASLNAPGTPVITHTSGTQSVGVGWAAPSGGLLPEGYYVTRVSEPGGVQVHVCGSPSVLVVPTSCVDTPVPVGSFHYLVTAVYRSWTSTSDPSPSVVIGTDGTPPVVTVTHVNGLARTFPFTSNAPVATIGGACGMVPGDLGTVAPLIGGAPTAPATAPCVAGAWTLTLTAPVTAQGSIVVSATQSDAAGNSGLAPAVTVTVDTIRPTVASIVRVGASPTGNAGPLQWTVTFSEPVSGVAASNFGLVSSGLTGGGAPTVSGVAATSGPPSATWTVTAALNGATSPAGSIGLNLANGALIVDPAGNTLLTAGFTGPAYGYDTVAPQVAVTGVSSSTANGSYKAGQSVVITVPFTESVIVGGAGTPQLTLATGNPATTAVDLTGGSGTTTLTFTYTVAAGNTSTDLDYASTSALALNGATITDAAGNAALLTLAAPAATGSLGANKALVIDTTPPVVTVTRVNTALQTFPYITRNTVTSVGGACGIASGDLAPVAVMVDGSPVGSVNCTAGGTWNLALSPQWANSGTRIVSAMQADSVGNTGSAPAQTIIVDKNGPTVLSINRAGPSPSVSTGPLTWTVTFSEPVTGVATTNFGTFRSAMAGVTPTISAVTPSGGSPSATWTVSVGMTGATGTNAGSIRLDLTSRGAIADPAGNRLPNTTFTTGQAYTYDTTAPTVSSVSADVPDGRYGIGAVIPVTVTFTEPMVVSGPGTPQLTLATGVPAATPVGYTSGSGTATLTFAYTVVSPNASADLNYLATTSLALNGGTITDAAGNVATLTLPAVGAGTSLGGAKNLVIDTVIPTVTSVSSPLADGSYRAGQVVPVTVTFSEAVTVTGIPQLALATGDPVTTAVGYTSGSGTSVLTFTYQVEPGNTATDLDYSSAAALALNGGAIEDLAGNPAVLALAAPGTAGSLGNARNLVIDTTPPAVTVTHVNGSARTFPYTTGANLTSFGGTCSTGVGDVAMVSPRINGAGTIPATATCQPGGTWTLTLTTPLSGSGSRTLSATQGDQAGNTGTAPTQTVVLDTTPPTVSSIVREGTSQLVNAGPLAWTVTFSEPVSGVAAGNFTLATSGLSGSPSTPSVTPVGAVPTPTWTVTVGMGGVSGTNAGSIGLNLTGPGSIADAVGNALGAGTVTGQVYDYDTAAPTVVGVSSTLADGSYGAGQVVPVTVTFSEPVTVTGTPQLTLATGPSATTEVDLTSGAGSATLTFEYTVADGDNSADLDYAATDALALNGGTIRDAAGNAAALALAAPGATGSLGDAADLIIDTAAPEVVVEQIEATNFLGFIRLLRVRGTAEVGSGLVTVYLCSGQPTCNVSTATQTFTNVTVGATGAWLTGWSIQGQGSWYASATQTDAAGNVGTSAVLGPVAN
jgi:hypothetical protein